MIPYLTLSPYDATCTDIPMFAFALDYKFEGKTWRVLQDLAPGLSSYSNGQSLATW